ncbi:MULTISPECIES: TMEM165/GDT1 family protein [Burkholderiaceae]|uniref:TMEM165/GDT1 family protein n=1 Tax=Burkholderiaceae TaxID=119060 RepID=UPI0009680999|nr:MULTISPECIES: TMEM165/GDT1 family protein [Burkholderiaceae]MCG1019822.1 TMEM165/GDT1 family protein [Mycetohabitans sp. B4]SIT80205.1 Putative Ca2+/H+ antiporter, TMEM165/GDT1 family [Burkholderia sp. b13]
MIETLLVSISSVALAEIGDKTQLLCFALAARYRQPWPILFGMLAATLVNHTGASALGQWLLSVLAPSAMRWALALSFIAMGVWVLVPGKLRTEQVQPTHTKLGIFGTTLLTFFFAEMGDKTQIATVVLAARYHDLPSVIIGTTLGMMFANMPVIFLGKCFAHRLPTTAVRTTAAIMFIVLGGIVACDIGTRGG